MTSEISERATQLSTVLVAAGRIEALVEARAVYPGVIDDAEYEHLLTLLTMDLPEALDDPMFGLIPFDLEDPEWDNPETISSLQLAKSVARQGLALEFGIELPENLHALDTTLHLIAEKANENCSAILALRREREGEILMFDCVQPVYVFSNEEGAKAFRLMRFEKLFGVYSRYLKHYGTPQLRESPDPLRRYRHHLETRLRGAALQVDAEELSWAIEDLIMAASLDGAVDVWDEYIPQKINAVALVYESIRIEVPTRHLRLSRAEQMFLEAAEFAIKEQVRVTTLRFEAAIRGPSVRRPSSEGFTAPESLSIQLTADEEKAYAEARFKSRLPIVITGERVKRASNVLQIGSRVVHIANADLVLLLRLVVALQESPSGFVSKGGGRGTGGLVQEEGVVPGEVDQAIFRLRKALQPAIEDLDPTSLIEVQDGQLRLSTHRRYVIVCWEPLEDHPHRIVQRLLSQLRQIEARTSRPAWDAQ